jgi:hypothetical protein
MKKKFSLTLSAENKNGRREKKLKYLEALKRTLGNLILISDQKKKK